MNETIKHQLDHRTIRFFEDKSVEEDKIQAIFDVAGRTASSNNLQLSSIIRVNDPKIKKELADIATQEYIVDAPELWVFIADVYRNSQLYHELTQKEAYIGVNYLIQGITNANLMAQNVTNAVESLGLGAVYLGSILNDAQRLCDVLQLPKYTMPVIGVAFGYPAEKPQLKPRIPIQLRVFEDKYDSFDSYQKTLANFDEELTHYYDTRDKGRRSDSYFTIVKNRYSKNKNLRDDYLKVCKKQGFEIDLD